MSGTKDSLQHCCQRPNAQSNGYEAINVMPNRLPINSPTAMPMLFPKRALTRLPTLPSRRIGELLPHHWVSVDYSLPSCKGQVQTKLPGKDEGDEQQAQEG